MFSLFTTHISSIIPTSGFTSQNNDDGFLPIGDSLCPDGGCRVFDPTNTDGGLDGFVQIVVNIAGLATYIIAAIAILYFIYAAFLFLTGGEEGGKKGRKVIINAIIAVVIAALSFTFIQLLINVLNEIQL